MRRRAGHGWTGIFPNKRYVPLMMDAAGRWVTTYTARHWPRCSRCRSPEELFPFGSTLCTTCFFYGGTLCTDEFWRIHHADYPLAPYNIGQRMMKLGMQFDRRGMSEPKASWRKLLREEVARFPSIAKLVEAWHAANPDFKVQLADGTVRTFDAPE